MPRPATFIKHVCDDHEGGGIPPLQFGLEFRDLRCAIAAADHGSFRKAAICLGIQESSVSRRVRDLEAGIGSKLFTRTTNGVCLTPAGRKFIQSVREALRQIHAAASSVRSLDSSDGRQLRIGTSTYFAAGRFLDLLERFGADNFNLVPLPSFAEPEEITRLIVAHDLDLVVMPMDSPPHECDTALLWEEDLYLAMRDDHLLASKPKLMPADIADQRLLVNQEMLGWGVSPFARDSRLFQDGSSTIQYYSFNASALINLAIICKAIAIIPASCCDLYADNVVYRPLTGRKTALRAISGGNQKDQLRERFLEIARLLSGESA